jgi:hypothetical protein
VWHCRTYLSRKECKWSLSLVYIIAKLPNCTCNFAPQSARCQATQPLLTMRWIDDSTVFCLPTSITENLRPKSKIKNNSLPFYPTIYHSAENRDFSTPFAAGIWVHNFVLISVTKVSLRFIIQIDIAKAILFVVSLMDKHPFYQLCRCFVAHTVTDFVSTSSLICTPAKSIHPDMYNK